MIWRIGLIVVAAVGFAGIIYLTGAIGRFGLIRKVSGERKWLRRLIALAVVLAGLALSARILSWIDAIVILLHVLFFFLVFGLVQLVAEKLSGRRAEFYWQGWLALLTAAVWLAAGYCQCVRVWKTEYSLSSEKPVETLRVALLSDAHIGTTFDGEGFAAHMDEIMRQEPDMVLVAGDFVDDNTSCEDMLAACRALGRADAGYGVWFVYGNHDRGYFNGRDFSSEELSRALEENQVHVLEDETAYVGGLCIVGRRDASSRRRAELAELLQDVDPDRYIIVLDHQPTDYERESATDADLVVSGHTHGGQLIPLGVVGELFAGNDRTYGHERRNGTDFIVTSGISDWAVHFKTGTRSEYVIIDIIGAAQEQDRP